MLDGGVTGSKVVLGFVHDPDPRRAVQLRGLVCAPLEGDLAGFKKVRGPRGERRGPRDAVPGSGNGTDASRTRVPGLAPNSVQNGKITSLICCPQRGCCMSVICPRPP